MTVVQLRRVCKGRLLTQGGLRDELISKLEMDDKGRTEIKFRAPTTPKRTRGGFKIDPQRVKFDDDDHHHQHDDDDAQNNSPTLQTPSKKPRRKPPETSVNRLRDDDDDKEDDIDDKEDDIVDDYDDDEAKNTVSNPEESQKHDEDDAQEPPPQISESPPSKSTSKDASPGEIVKKSEDFGASSDEVPPVHQHQNEAGQDHRHGEG